jgi:rhodanese-related sulfurtransferase
MPLNLTIRSALNVVASPISLERRRVLIASLVLGLPPARASAFLWNSTPKNWDELDRLIARKFPNIPSVSTQQLASALARPALPMRGSPLATMPLLLDVRPIDEYSISYLPGALHAPDETKIVEAIQKAATSPVGAQPCVLYCSVGYRSAQWVEKLTKRGHKNIYNLNRSLFMWANEGRALENKQGVATQVHPFSKEWEHLLEPQFRALIKPNG